jgi:hypothetical protein
MADLVIRGGEVVKGNTGRGTFHYIQLVRRVQRWHPFSGKDVQSPVSRAIPYIEARSAGLSPAEKGEIQKWPFPRQPVIPRGTVKNIVFPEHV